MAPEAKLVEYARHIHLHDEDVDYILSLFQEARAASAIAGAEHEREECARLAATARTISKHLVGPHVGWDADEIDAGIAAAIRARGKGA